MSLLHLQAEVVHDPEGRRPEDDQGKEPIGASPRDGLVAKDGQHPGKGHDQVGPDDHVHGKCAQSLPGDVSSRLGHEDTVLDDGFWGILIRSRRGLPRMEQKRTTRSPMARTMMER